MLIAAAAESAAVVRLVVDPLQHREGAGAAACGPLLPLGQR
jgi:hypothetical protein